jgi:hypothetical protein
MMAVKRMRPDMTDLLIDMTVPRQGRAGQGAPSITCRLWRVCTGRRAGRKFEINAGRRGELPGGIIEHHRAGRDPRASGRCEADALSKREIAPLRAAGAIGVGNRLPRIKRGGQRRPGGDVKLMRADLKNRRMHRS